jgi:hypothetical protein
MESRSSLRCKTSNRAEHGAKHRTEHRSMPTCFSICKACSVEAAGGGESAVDALTENCGLDALIGDTVGLVDLLAGLAGEHADC